MSNWLGAEWPIIQAPMAGSQGSALAIAVCNAGGVGSLPCAMLDGGTRRRELKAMRSGTARPFNVNFFCHAVPQPNADADARWRAALRPYYDECGLDQDAIIEAPGRLPFDAEAATLLHELRPPVVSFHFGLPGDDALASVRATGAKIVGSATTVAEARWLERKGVDAVVAQGVEGGGHRGMFLTDDIATQMGTFALLPQIVRAVRVPVVAAGGIADAAGVRAAFALGASAVQVGTAFLLCPEATPSAVHRAAILNVDERPTALTNLLTGRPARGLLNRLMTELGPMNPVAPAFPRAVAALLPLRTYAEARGIDDFSPLWCGQAVAACRSVAAADVVRELVRGVPVAL